jgi:hypothetical protein
VDEEVAPLAPLYLPAGQLAHVVMEVAPLAPLYLPAGQAEQDGAPVPL